MSEVQIESAAGVLTITFDAPERLNGFTPEMLNEAAQAIEVVPAGTRLVVVTGSGRAFSSGAGLGGEFRGIELLDGSNRLIRAIVATPVPVVAGVNGIAAGVASSIAFAADIAVAKTSAYFLLAFVNIGLMPDGGSTELVAASVGRARANAMALLGERMPASEAAAAGLIHLAVEDDEYEDALARVVGKLCAGATVAYGATKKAITATTLTHLEDALERERAGQIALFDSEDWKEGSSAFLEKRPARFTGA